MVLPVHRRRGHAMVLGLSVLVVFAVAVWGCSSSPREGDGPLAAEVTEPASATPTTAPTAPPLATVELEVLVQDWLAAEGIVGAVAAVATPNTATIVAAGLRELGSPDAIEPGHRFRIGSITKLFTATLVMRLVEEGVIDLDRAVSEYLPDAPAGITVAHLLGHSSGLVDRDGTEAEAIAAEIMAALTDPSTIESPAEVAAETLGRETAFEPGSHHQYSNSGYLVLHQVIEAATGTDYHDALNELVLEPAGLDNTGIDTGAADMAAPHERLGADQPPFSLAAMNTDGAVRATGAAAGLVSDVHDLITFAQALFGGRILAADSLATMTDTTRSADPGYGLGTDIYDLDGYTVFGHDGRITGYGASLRHDPSSGLTVVVLANQGTFATRPFANQLVRTRILRHQPYRTLRRDTPSQWTPSEKSDPHWSGTDRARGIAPTERGRRLCGEVERTGRPVRRLLRWSSRIRAVRFRAGAGFRRTAPTCRSRAAL